MSKLKNGINLIHQKNNYLFFPQNFFSTPKNLILYIVFRSKLEKSSVAKKFGSKKYFIGIPTPEILEHSRPGKVG
jgi:hypothetical protein